MPPQKNLFQKTLSLQTTNMTQIHHNKNFYLIYSHKPIQIHFRPKIYDITRILVKILPATRESCINVFVQVLLCQHPFPHTYHSLAASLRPTGQAVYLSETMKTDS